MSTLDESEVLTIPVTRDTDYEFKLVAKNSTTKEPEDISDAQEITFLFRDDESDGVGASSNVVSALHNLGSTAAYVDTGGETLDFAATGNTITRSAGDWTVDNFTAGQRIRVEGSASNDGCYKVASVAALVLTLETTDPDGLATAKTVTDETGLAGSAATITAPELAAADLRKGVITVTGPPSDLSGKDLGTLFGSARILRGAGTTQQAPRRSARIRLES